MTIDEINKMELNKVPLHAIDIALVNAVESLAGAVNKLTEAPELIASQGSREASGDSQAQYLCVNPAREDQETVYLLCTFCGCLVRSDYEKKHRKICTE